MPVEVRPICADDYEAADAIMHSLPEWFGHTGGLDDCARAVRTGRGWVVDIDGWVAAFATWEERTPYTAEITWMAVLRDSRNTGLGTQLIEHACEELRERGYSLALAMTSAAHKVPTMHEGPDPYDATRAFWVRRGFLPIAELDIWDTDIALLMVRPL